jgi:aromatic-amino-acid transaminase
LDMPPENPKAVMDSNFKATDMFSRIPTVADDSILGLIQKFKDDPNPKKVDLGVGVYRNAKGETPIMRAVKLAEKQLIETETTKTYTDSHGAPEFGLIVTRLILGDDLGEQRADQVSATQTPGGSGALRLAADLIAQEFPEKTMWVPAPTWPNHKDIFTGAGLKLDSYPYLSEGNSLDFPAMAAALRQIPEGDVVLLHACCHNPSGYDLSPGQWREVVAIIQEHKLLPLVDFAYQGFGDGLTEDAYGVRLLAAALDEMLVTYSSCKNFGIYVERPGCLLVLTENHQAMLKVRGRIATIARSIYSSPPGHGSAIVKTVLSSDELKSIWHDELGEMRNRIKAMRSRLVDSLKAYDLDQRFAHIGEQKGLFSYTGLTSSQVEYLQKKYSVYLIGSGRANIAGLAEHNVDYVSQAIADAVAAVD